MAIGIKSDDEIAAMREAGSIVARILRRLATEVRPGMRTADLDDVCVEELSSHGAKSSFKGYRGFPAHICTSVNDEVVHGIPGQRMLHEGDVLSIDVGVVHNGFQGDAAVTVAVGGISAEARRLLDVTEGALGAGIAAAKENARLGDVSAAIQGYVESRGFSVVREYTGHGIGREMPGHGPRLRRGMTLAIEPMVNSGGWSTRVGDDHWTVVTADGSLSAHFEHTIAVTDGEPEILTLV
jgi:methionyl aminopeptidase